MRVYLKSWNQLEREELIEACGCGCGMYRGIKGDGDMIHPDIYRQSPLAPVEVLEDTGICYYVQVNPDEHDPELVECHRIPKYWVEMEAK